jgi:branched-chain amino acid transport system substrate-binding protein
MGNEARDNIRCRGLFVWREAGGPRVAHRTLGGCSAGRAEIPVGLVFSRTGSYSTVGEELLNGALLAIEEINDSPEFDFRFRPRIENPGGDLNEYRHRCEDLLRNKAVRHVVGCYTSSSRKEVIPAFEKRDALLWYPSHYEGFESCNNVIYTGAAPNQHIVPLIEYMLREYGDRVYCIGSNYIWAWENNRIMREIVLACQGSVVAEKYLPVGSTDIRHFIDEISATKPSFIFNTLIGESSYAFLRAFYEAGKTDPAFDPATMPVTSCTLSEPELLSVGGRAASGHIASSVYFQSKDRPQNRTFASRFKARFGNDKVTSADAEASYIAAVLLARAIQKAQSTEIEQVKQAVYTCEFEAPQGPVRIDPDNNHSYLTPSLGRSVPGGQYEIIWSADQPVKPDPYLVCFDVRRFFEGLNREANGAYPSPRPHLRVVK